MSKSNDYLKALGASYNLIGSECQIKDEIKKIIYAWKKVVTRIIKMIPNLSKVHLNSKLCPIQDLHTGLKSLLQRLQNVFTC
jgi:hypothetical protein